jgi:lipopolysaccharide export system permease protein
VLIAIVSAVEFVGQLDDVGIAQYGLNDALAYVALRIPRMVFEVLPAAALLGALLSLGNLAVHRELVVMRASGISLFQLLISVGLAGFVLMILMVLLGESFAPSLGAYARALRAQALLDEGNLATGESAWLKDGNRIINLRRPGQGAEFDGGIFLYELADDTALARIARADAAGIEQSNQWLLIDYAETAFAAAGTTTRHAASMEPDYDISPDLLGLSVVREDLLDTPTLTRYIRYLQASGLDASSYLHAYWSRIANTVAVVFMVVLALPFVFGSLRSAGTGARMLVGLVIGLGFYVVGQVSSSGGEVFNLDPVLVAWAPTAALILTTAIALSRVR